MYIPLLTRARISGGARVDAIYGGRNGMLGNLRLNVGAVEVIIRVRSEGKMEPTCRIAGSACMAQPEHQKTKIYRSALSAGAGLLI